MSVEVEPLDPRAHPATRGYTIVCLGALLVMVVVLVQREPRWLALLPLLTGSVAVAACWSVGPPLVLLCVGGSLVVQLRQPDVFAFLVMVAKTVGIDIAGGPGVQLRQRISAGQGSLAATDLVLAGALLAYSAGQYRLQSLLRHAFPPDPRRRRRLPKGRPAVMPVPPADVPRAPELVGGNELTALVLAVLGITGLTAAAWVLLATRQPPLDFSRWEWQAVVIIWLSCVIAGAAWVATGYLRWQQASPEESLLYLQDQLWRQTRREQSRLNRWLVWYRLRRQRRQRRRENKP
jgi:hypothetical protein